MNNVAVFAEPIQGPRLRRTPINLLKTALYRALYCHLPLATVELYGSRFKAVHYRALERIFVTRTYEPMDFQYLSDRSRAGQMFLDIGANVGFYTLFMERCLDASAVLAVEPSRREVELLLANVLSNKARDVQVIQKAVSQYERHELLSVAKDFHRGANAIGNFYYADTPLKHMEPIETTTVDRLILDQRLLPRVDWIKVDTDGHELAVMLGARGTLARYHPRLLLEYPSPVLVSWLMSIGYRPERLQGMYNTGFVWEGA